MTRHSGALVATAAIEILKIGFTIYIGAMSYYQTVYGALAAIPIFLLWMYISWMAVLVGAEVAAAVPHWRIDERLGMTSFGGVQLGLSLALIAALARAQRSGAIPATRSLAAELGVATTVIDEHMKPLAAAGFAAHTQAGNWVLAWNPENASLRDLYDALHLPFAGSWLGNVSAPWQRQIAPAIERIVRAEAGRDANDDRCADRRGEAEDGAAHRSGWPGSADAIRETIGSEQVQGSR